MSQNCSILRRLFKHYKLCILCNYKCRLIKPLTSVCRECVFLGCRNCCSLAGMYVHYYARCQWERPARAHYMTWRGQDTNILVCTATMWLHWVGSVTRVYRDHLPHWIAVTQGAAGCGLLNHFTIRNWRGLKWESRNESPLNITWYTHV